MFDVNSYSSDAQDAIKSVVRKSELLNAATGKRHEAYASMFIAFTEFFKVASEADAKVFEIDFRNNAFLRTFIPMFERRNMNAYYKRSAGELFGSLIYGPGVKDEKADGKLSEVLMHLSNTKTSPVAAVKFAPEHKDKDKADEAPLISVRNEAFNRYYAMMDGLEMALKYTEFNPESAKSMMDKLTEKETVRKIIAAIADDIRKERNPEPDALSEALDAITD